MNSNLFISDCSATVANLQSQVESLTTTNALMKEDLEIAKGNIIALMQENTVLKTQKNQKQIKHKKDVSRIDDLSTGCSGSRPAYARFGYKYN